ncbi:hypothetical protein HPB47_001977 [Ixodes persulcatus]|uniref:Uncharacterized protein n=1 Tax=Ixodes persulcatus TaxID=34615 RepID=A0AC60PNQ9_IXOPE|nr:hypothetical protein HPB47_001977 [Ixodes persulcatus]
MDTKRNGSGEATELKSTNHRHPVIERIDSGTPAVRTAPTVDEIQTGTIVGLPGRRERTRASCGSPFTLRPRPGLTGNVLDSTRGFLRLAPIRMPVERVMNETPELSTNHGETTGVNVPTSNSFECLGGGTIPTGSLTSEEQQQPVMIRQVRKHQAGTQSSPLATNPPPPLCAAVQLCRSAGERDPSRDTGAPGFVETWILGGTHHRQTAAAIVNSCGAAEEMAGCPDERCAADPCRHPPTPTSLGSRSPQMIAAVPLPVRLRRTLLLLFLSSRLFREGMRHQRAIQAEIRAALTALVPRIVAELKSMIVTTISGLHAPTLDTE